MKRRDLLKTAPLALLGCDPDGLGLSNPNFLVVGHHGAPNLAPENTLRSFEASVAVGANTMEIDLCVTKDNVLVAFHDRDPDSGIALARQAGGEGYQWLPFVPGVDSPWRRPVSALTLSELRQFYGYRRKDGGRDFSAVIPTFTEVLEWVASVAERTPLGFGNSALGEGGSAGEAVGAAGEAGAGGGKALEPPLKAIYLDLKFDPKAEGAAGAELIRQLWDAWQGSAALQKVRFYLLTVHAEFIAALKREQADLGAEPLRVVWDFEHPGALDATLKAGLRDVSTGLTPSFTWSDYKREIAQAVRARQAGKIDSVLAWTFDREMQLAELLYYSVDGIITNEPASLYRMWQETLA